MAVSVVADEKLLGAAGFGYADNNREV